MSNNDKKTIISICPFQTQMLSQIPVTRGHVLTSNVPAPQILKVQCDREKCQLWNTTEDVCAVSVLPGIEERLVELNDVLHCTLGDINDTMGDLKKHIASWLPSR